MLGHFDLHVLLDGHLAGQTFAVLGFALGDVRQLGGEDVATAFMHLQPALGAGTTTTAGRRDEQTVLGQRCQQLAAGRHGQGALVVHQQGDIALRDQFAAREQNDQHQ